MRENTDNQISGNNGHSNNVTVADQRIATFLPRADVVERGDSLLLLLDLPGVGESGLDIHFEKNTLTVTGNLDRYASDNLEPLFSECAVGGHVPGRYRRSFTVSDAFDSENISARMKDGVLSIELPKSSKQKARKIPIQSS